MWDGRSGALQSIGVVDGMAPLLTSEKTLRRFNRGVAQPELNLFAHAPGEMTQTGARSPQIVRRGAESQHTVGTFN
jgi:hypothetical protein